MRLSADGKACDINAVILQHDENRQIEIIIRLPKVNKHREQEHAERGSMLMALILEQTYWLKTYQPIKTLQI